MSAELTDGKVILLSLLFEVLLRKLTLGAGLAVIVTLYIIGIQRGYAP